MRSEVGSVSGSNLSPAAVPFHVLHFERIRTLTAGNMCREFEDWSPLHT